MGIYTKTWAGFLTAASITTASMAGAVSFSLVQTHTAETPRTFELWGEYIDLNQSILMTGSLAPAGSQIDLFTNSTLFTYDDSQEIGHGGGSPAIGDFTTIRTANTHTVNGAALAGEVFLRDTLTGEAVNPASAQNASDFGYAIERNRQFGRWAAAHGSNFVISDQRAGATAQEAVIFSHNPITGITQSVQVTGGSSVDIDGNYAAIVTGGTTGSVRLYKKTDGIWSDEIVATIAAPVGASTQFGRSPKAVAYDDSTGLLVVGDLHGDSTQGSVWVFQRIQDSEQFALIQRINSPNPEQNGLFGRMVSIDDGRLVVAAHNEERAYVFDFNDALGGLALTQTINATASVTDVAVSDNIIALGFGRATVNGMAGAGMVEVYLEDGTTIAPFAQPAPVPLPASGLLLLVGLGALGAARRRVTR